VARSDVLRDGEQTLMKTGVYLLHVTLTPPRRLCFCLGLFVPSFACLAAPLAVFTLRGFN